jgi:hypothetical protein
MVSEEQVEYLFNGKLQHSPEEVQSIEKVSSIESEDISFVLVVKVL